MSTYTISEKPSSDRMWLVKVTMSHSYSALQCPETMDVFASREENCRIDVVDKFHKKKRTNSSYENECASGSTYMIFFYSY